MGTPIRGHMTAVQKTGLMLTRRKGIVGRQCL